MSTPPFHMKGVPDAADRNPAALGLSRTVLSALRILNVAYAIGILGLLVVSILNPDWLFRAIRVPSGPAWGAVAIGMRAIMIVGIAGAFVVHRILTTLREMVDTVRAGDPFVRTNAERLESLAWLVLGAELLHVVVGLIEKWVSTPLQPIDLRLQYSVTPWLAVLLLFVLARVFDHGARMREDVEGMV